MKKNVPLITKAVIPMVLLNAFTTPLMLSAANVALPGIAIDLNLDAVTLSWIPMAYLMASAMFVLIFGRVADIYGRKRIFLIGTVSVIITSVLAACSVNGTMLIIFRFMQGVSAAMLYATQIAIISSVSSPEKRGHAIGLTVSMIYLGLTCGPVMGGYFVDLFGWRASFIFYVPLAFIVLFIGLFKVQGEWTGEIKGVFDSRGAFIYAVSIMTFCTGVAKLPQLTGFILLVISVYGIFLFFRHEKICESPLFDVKLFYTNRIFTCSSLASYLIYTATYANVVLISLYLQYLQSFSAIEAGLIMMTQPLTMAIFSPVAGKLSDKIEPRFIASLGMVVTAIGLMMLASLNAGVDLNQIIIALVITGLGFSLFSSPNVNAVMSSVEKNNYGSATGSLATMRILGQLSSMVIVTLVFALIIGAVEIDISNYDLLLKSIQISFLLAASLCIPGFVLSTLRGHMHTR